MQIAAGWELILLVFLVLIANLLFIAAATWIVRWVWLGRRKPEVSRITVHEER